MIHAKTMVADGVWSRVGSSNMNSASLLGNWEIDAGIFDPDLAAQMEGLFLADLASSREIVLPASMVSGGADGPGDDGQRVTPQTTLGPGRTLQERLEKWRQGPKGSSGWRIADLVRAGSALGEGLAGHRTLGREDRTVLGTTAVLVLAIAIVAGFFPLVVGWVVAFFAGWFGIVLGVRALLQAREARAKEEEFHRENREQVRPGNGVADDGTLPAAAPDSNSGAV
jgi:cardiolipin synthase